MERLTLIFEGTEALRQQPEPSHEIRRPPKGPPGCGGEDLVETWLTLYLSLHVCFTTLIHAVSDTGRGLNAAFHHPLPVFTQLGQPSPA